MNNGTDVVVDDHLLFRILLNDEPEDLRRAVGRIFTTGLWYHRLCRAVSNEGVVGAISRRLGTLDATLGSSVARAVTTLPDTVGLLTLRELAWPMATLLHHGARLNLLSLEALAAAEHLQAELCIAEADANPPLIAAAAARGVTTRLIAA